MSQAQPEFLPLRLRPELSHRQRRGRLLLVALLPALTLLLPMWRVQAVEVDGGGALPPAATSALDDLCDSPVLTLDLDRIRQRLESYPGVAGVQVHLELPGTLQVSARKASVCASVAIGRRWHGVDCNGSLAGPLERSAAPILTGFSHRNSGFRQGLAVADRLARSSGARVEELRQIMPGDILATLLFDHPAGPHRAQALVDTRGSDAERYWYQQLDGGLPTSSWVDLRSDRRLVQRNSNTAPAADSDRGGRS